MPRSEAQKRADKKYNLKRNVKQLTASVKPDDYAMIDNYCKSTNISKAKFIVGACKYCIDNNIDLTTD